MGREGGQNLSVWLHSLDCRSRSSGRFSTAAGDSYNDLDEVQLRDELGQRGFTPGVRELDGAMQALKDDGYIECTFTGDGIELIRLDTLGRQAVEGWPVSPGTISATDVEQLVRELERRADDPTLTTDERSRARTAAAAVGNLGASVASGVIIGWLKSIGIG